MNASALQSLYRHVHIFQSLCERQLCFIPNVISCFCTFPIIFCIKLCFFLKSVFSRKGSMYGRVSVFEISPQIMNMLSTHECFLRCLNSFLCAIYVKCFPIQTNYIHWYFSIDNNWIWMGEWNVYCIFRFIWEFSNHIHMSCWISSVYSFLTREKHFLDGSCIKLRWVFFISFDLSQNSSIVRLAFLYARPFSYFSERIIFPFPHISWSSLKSIFIPWILNISIPNKDETFIPKLLLMALVFWTDNDISVVTNPNLLYKLSLNPYEFLK